MGEIAEQGSVAVAVAVGVSIMWEVTPDTWQVTPDMWHMTPDTLHLTHDTWQITPDMWQLIYIYFIFIGATIHTRLEIQCLPYAGFCIYKKKAIKWIWYFATVEISIGIFFAAVCSLG